MPRLKQTILILAAATLLLLPACSPSDDVTLPASGNTNITVTTPPKPAFSGDGAQTRFNQETSSWEVGDVATLTFDAKDKDGQSDDYECVITCVAVNTDGSAAWKIENFPTDIVEIAMDKYTFDYFGPDRYHITTDYIWIDYKGGDEIYTSITDAAFRFSMTNMERSCSRFRLTGLQKGDYVIVDNNDFYSPYETTGKEAIKNIRFIAADDEDTYIYMYTEELYPITITVARRGVTLSKKLNMDSEDGKAYSIDISTFKAFDGENPQDVTWIHNATELQDFANAVNGGNNYKNKTVRLACDIDCGSIDNFPMIGNSGKVFNGTFDGNGYIIRSLTMAGNGDIALFYGINTDGTVKNLTLENINVTGIYFISGFAYGNLGTIDHCAVGGKLTATDSGSGVSSGFVSGNTGTVTYCTAGVQASGGAGYFGFTAENAGTIERCGVTGTTTLSESNVVGFTAVNDNNHYIIGCYSDVKLADGSTPDFYKAANNGIAYCRSGNKKEIIGDWGDDTGWYRTDTPEGVLKLYWEE